MTTFTKISFACTLAIAGSFFAVNAIDYTASNSLPIKKAASTNSVKVSRIIVEYKDANKAKAAAAAFSSNTRTQIASVSNNSKASIAAMNLSTTTANALSTKRVMHQHVVYNLGKSMTVSQAEEIAREMRKDPNVQSAMADLPVKSFSYGPGGSGAQLQWHLGSDVYAGANFKEAWKISEGSSDVTVSIIDTGFTDHPDLDLANKLVGQYDFVSDVTAAGDTDGWDDKGVDEGDFCTENGVTTPSSWHGSKVAGTVTTAYNSSTTLGVAPNVSLINARALGRCGGSLSDIISAILWSAGYPVENADGTASPKLLNKPADVINLSLGVPLTEATACPSTIQSAINAAVGAGSTVVAAAGNENNGFLAIPAVCSNVIAVAATGKAGDLSSYSNYGAGTTLGAPGGQYVENKINEPFYTLGVMGESTVPTFMQYSGGYGTSFAAPVVAGAAALLKSVVPSATPADISFILKHTAKAYPGGSFCSKLTSDCGAGILDAAAALQYINIYYGSTLTMSGPSGATPAGSDVTLVANMTGTSANLTDIVYVWKQEDTGAPRVEYSQIGNSITFKSPDYAGSVTFSVKAINPRFTYSDKVSISTTANHAPVMENQTVNGEIVSGDMQVSVKVTDSDNNLEHLILTGDVPTGLTSSGAMLQWGSAKVGTYKFKVQAVDYFGATSDTVDVTLVVKEAQQVPDTGSSGGGAFGIELLLLAVLGVFGLKRHKK